MLERGWSVVTDHVKRPFLPVPDVAMSQRSIRHADADYGT